MNSLLEVKNLKKHFGGIYAVNDCSFQIEHGKMAALIGPNGAGKSTVFNLISGILAPDSGEVTFGEQNITGNSIEEISILGVSRLLQHSRLFRNLTVRENLSLALDSENTRFWKNLFGFNSQLRKQNEKVSSVLNQVGLEGVENQLAADLSYGQRRLVDLARAMLHPHKLLLLDEPVAGVHPRLRKSISSLLLQLKSQGETILFVEHDMTFTLNTADSVIVMSSGQVIAHGTPQEIQKDQRVIEAYLGEQASA